MIHTGVPVSALEREDDVVIWTLADLLGGGGKDRPDQPDFIDPADPSTIPEAWR